MIITIKYFLILSLYAFGVIIFGLFIYIHGYMQKFSCYLCKEYETTNSIYDYIVVGSGTAGSIVAQRLAENRQHSVLLLEAGPYSHSLFSIPAIGPLLQMSHLDWNYETVPQTYSCRGLNNYKSRWPMGRVVGGTSRLNNMIHTRGHKEDYDEWFKDNKDYNYERDVLEYFRKIENRIYLKEQNSTIHSEGPMYVNELTFESPLIKYILDATNSLEYSMLNTDHALLTGFGKPYINTINGKRWTSSDALLQKQLENLKIITHAHVYQVLLRNNFEAYAVKYKHLNEKRKVQARKGIILSAGVVGTPKILLLSGIGPAKHLTDLKITVRKDLPVGENLQDHITTGLDLIILNTTLPVTVEKMVSIFSAYDYFFTGKGPWTSVGCEVIGFCTINSKFPTKKPDLQFMILPFGLSLDGGIFLRKAVSVSNNVWESYFKPLIKKQVISILPIILHPKSRGNILLKSKNFESPPIINPNYLSFPEDVEILLEGINFIKKLIATKSMQKIGAKINEQKFPGCESFEFDSKKYWECYLRHLTLTSFHPVGTCKMGSSSDSESVVDYEFKVIGTNKLYVADASVIPELPSGNINAVVGMIAEKVADSVKYVDYKMKGVCKRKETFLVKNIC